MILERDYEFGGRLVTIHDVDVTPDLKQCFVFVGILGKEGPGTDEMVLKKLESHRGQIQRSLYKRVILRNSPQLFFRVDHSVERGVRVLNLIESLPEPLPDEAPADDEAKP